MSDSRSYPLNTYLINNVEDIIKKNHNYETNQLLKKMVDILFIINQRKPSTSRNMLNQTFYFINVVK